METKQDFEHEAEIKLDLIRIKKSPCFMFFSASDIPMCVEHDNIG